MIIVGIEDCPTCKVVKGMLVDVKYVELQRNKVGQKTDPEIFEIKKALGKLNYNGKFPVVFSDDLKKMVLTDVLLDNLKKEKLEMLIS